MMKRILISAVMILCVSVFGACGEEEASSKRVNSGTSSVSDVLEQRMEEDAAQKDTEDTVKEAEEDTEENGAGTEEAADGVPGSDNSEAVGAATDYADGTIDIDLTELSSTMVYSEVSNMMTYPQDYTGKIVKMEGAYSLYKDPESGNEYRACIIRDATACCAQGIEFITDTPGKCPEDGGEVTVVGVFDTYYEGEYLYCTLRDAQIL